MELKQANRKERCYLNIEGVGMEEIKTVDKIIIPKRSKVVMVIYCCLVSALTTFYSDFFTTTINIGYLRIALLIVITIGPLVEVLFTLDSNKTVSWEIQKKHILGHLIGWIAAIVAIILLTSMIESIH